MLNFNKSRSYDVVAIAGSSNINARADDSMDCGRRLCTNDDTLFVRCVIVVDVDGDDDGIIVAITAVVVAIAVVAVAVVIVIVDALGFLIIYSHNSLKINTIIEINSF